MKNKLLLAAFLSLGLISGPTAFAKATMTNTKSKQKKSDSIDMSAVRSVVKSHMAEVQKCYTDLIIEGMAVKGKVVVTWEIDAQGAAQNVSLKDPQPEMQAVSGCVTEKVSAWPFPAAKGEKPFPVSYSFDFGS